MMQPGQGAEALKELAKFAGLRKGREFSKERHIECGVSKAMADLYLATGINPIRLAALAMEDLNYHGDAAILFKMVSE